MNVDSVAGDPELLAAHGWGLSTRSRSRLTLGGTVTTCVAREGVYSGERHECPSAQWLVQFSDRARVLLGGWPTSGGAGYGFRRRTPARPRLHAFCTIEEAADAVRLIEANFDRASATPQR
jgi:hypothetical protein